MSWATPTWALVLGVLSFPLLVLCGFGVVLSVASLALGVIVLRQDRPSKHKVAAGFGMLVALTSLGVFAWFMSTTNVVIG